MLLQLTLLGEPYLLLKAAFNQLQGHGVLLHFPADLILIIIFPLITDPMLHAGPEIHGQGPKLDLHRIILHGVQTVDRHPKHDMKAAVPTGLWILDIILLLNDNQIGRASCRERV